MQGSYTSQGKVRIFHGGPKHGCVAQLAEARNLKFRKCEFESHHSYQLLLDSTQDVRYHESMINLAGQPKNVCDEQCRKELEEAGIPLFPFKILQKGEVKTDVMGHTARLNDQPRFDAEPNWQFVRAWKYWIATMHFPSSNGFNIEKAMKLHAEYGTVVRVAGNCTCPSPEGWWGKNGIPYYYHIDTQEGLNAFAKAILE